MTYLDDFRNSFFYPPTKPLSDQVAALEQKAANLESKLAGAERELCARSRRILQLESDVRRLEQRCAGLGIAAAGAAMHRAIERDLKIAQLQAAPFYEYMLADIKFTRAYWDATKPTADEAFAGVERGEKWECKPKGAKHWLVLRRRHGAVWAYYVSPITTYEYTWLGTWSDLRAGEFRRATP